MPIQAHVHLETSFLVMFIDSSHFFCHTLLSSSSRHSGAKISGKPWYKFPKVEIHISTGNWKDNINSACAYMVYPVTLEWPCLILSRKWITRWTLMCSLLYCIVQYSTVLYPLIFTLVASSPCPEYCRSQTIEWETNPIVSTMHNTETLLTSAYSWY